MKKEIFYLNKDWFYWTLVTVIIVFLVLLIIIFIKEGFPTW